MSESKKKKILFVDDEIGVLQGLERMLFEMAEQWDMHFVDSAEKALHELSGGEFDVIVSDMRMPGMDGATLLAHVHDEYPNVVRVILTGYSELEATLRAMPVAHSFLTKPCKPALLEEVVRRSLDLQNLLDSESLRTVVGSVAGLPVRPEVYTRLTEAIADPHVELGHLARIVSADLSLAAKVLHLTNSAFFGSKRKFVNIEQAVSFIGIRMLRKVVLAAEVFSAFSQKQSLGGLSLEREQRHGLVCAGIARRIAPDPEIGEYAFLAGMVHDIGNLVLASRAPKLMRQLMRQKPGEQASQLTEIEVTGTTHGRIGAYLLGLWGIEQPIVEAVAFHHEPAVVRSSKFDLPIIVHVADAVVHSIENERAGRSKEIEVDREHLTALGVLDRLDEWRAAGHELWDRESG
ncbi:MAG TPA: response regulator, partial [Polyangiaceae bacterium]|nr:response regulator [Polyangiaceae bacterium]